MSKKSRTKGKSAELEVVKILRKHGPWPEAARDLEQVRGEDSGIDIINTGAWAFQVKRHKKITESLIRSAIYEAMETDHTKKPACIHRQDYQRKWRISLFACNFGSGWYYDSNPIIELDLIDFCKLCKEE